MKTNLNKLLSHLLSESTSYEDFIGDTTPPPTNNSEKNDSLLDIFYDAKKLGIVSKTFETLLLPNITKGEPLDVEDVLVQTAIKEIRSNIGKHINELNNINAELNSLVGRTKDSKEDISF